MAWQRRCWFERGWLETLQIIKASARLWKNAFTAYLTNKWTKSSVVLNAQQSSYRKASAEPVLSLISHCERRSTHSCVHLKAICVCVSFVTHCAGKLSNV